jgi:uncharacterized protein YukE
VTVNPLVAARIDQPQSAWAGVWIAEDIQLIAQGVENRSWVDGTLGVVGAGLDGLALVSDPVGALLQYGIAWLIEHVKPLSEALDWLAGDPGQIAGYAQTWRNVASSLRNESDSLAKSVRFDLTEWQGAASDAYRNWATQRDQSLQALAQASDTMALITEGAGVLIGTVRMMVRDAVATVVSRLIVYAGELVASFGVATPLVVEQVTTLCASWAAKISHWLRDLIASIRNLMRKSDELAKLIEMLRRKLGGGSYGSHAPETPEPLKPPKDPKVEEERIHALGVDPAVGKFRAAEAETAQRLESQLGIELRRSEDPKVDWVDSMGTTYDAVGNFDGRYFDREWPRFQHRIFDHVDKADFVPVDVSRFSPEQKRLVADFIATNGLGPGVFMVGE